MSKRLASKFSKVMIRSKCFVFYFGNSHLSDALFVTSLFGIAWEVFTASSRSWPRVGLEALELHVTLFWLREEKMICAFWTSCLSRGSVDELFHALFLCP